MMFENLPGLIIVGAAFICVLIGIFHVNPKKENVSIPQLSENIPPIEKPSEAHFHFHEGANVVISFSGSGMPRINSNREIDYGQI